LKFARDRREADMPGALVACVDLTKMTLSGHRQDRNHALPQSWRRLSGQSPKESG